MITTRIVYLGVLLSIWMSAPADASVWTFHQTSSTVPEFHASGTIEMMGDSTLADLPTVASCWTPVPQQQPCAPPDFGNLTGLFIEGFSLASFHNPSGDPDWQFPYWSIGPQGIGFIDSTDHFDFFVNFAIGTIQYDQDMLGPCMYTGRCVATGEWVTSSVPEPSSGWLLVVALLGLLTLTRHAREALRGEGMGNLSVYA